MFNSGQKLIRNNSYKNTLPENRGPLDSPELQRTQHTEYSAIDDIDQIN
jgi:hypothetical protein